MGDTAAVPEDRGHCMYAVYTLQRHGLAVSGLKQTSVCTMAQSSQGRCRLFPYASALQVELTPSGGYISEAGEA
jgi:hypothetical protein